MQLLSELLSQAASEVDAANDLAALDAVRVSYLGKKGELTARLKSLGQLPADERASAGQEINKAKPDWLLTPSMYRCRVVAVLLADDTRSHERNRGLSAFSPTPDSAFVPGRK